MGPLVRRVTVMLGGSAACGARAKTRNEQRVQSRASDFIVFIDADSLTVELKKARAVALPKL